MKRILYIHIALLPISIIILVGFVYLNLATLKPSTTYGFEGLPYVLLALFGSVVILVIWTLVLFVILMIERRKQATVQVVSIETGNRLVSFILGKSEVSQIAHSFLMGVGIIVFIALSATEYFSPIRYLLRIWYQSDKESYFRYYSSSIGFFVSGLIATVVILSVGFILRRRIPAASKGLLTAGGISILLITILAPFF